MNTYTDLAVKYIKNNRKRTLVTIIGIGVAAAILFVFLVYTANGIDQLRQVQESMTQADAYFLNLDSGEKEDLSQSEDVKKIWKGIYLSENPFTNIFVNNMENVPCDYTLIAGEMPQKPGDVLASSDYSIGDVIDLHEEKGEQTEKIGEVRVTGIFTVKYNSYFEKIQEMYLLESPSLIGYPPLHQGKECIYVQYKNQKGIKEITEAFNNKFSHANSDNWNGSKAYYNMNYNFEDPSGTDIAVIVIIMIAVIILSFAVMVIKNTLRLSVMERMVDIGILRCSGASLSQIRRVIFREAILIGILGWAAGLCISVPALLVIHWNTHMSFLTWQTVLLVPVLLVAVWLSMAFSVIDPFSMVKKMSPVESIREQIKCKKESLKRRRGMLFKFLLGATGLYAYRNIMRNSKKFITNVLMIMMGVTLLVGTEAVIKSLEEWCIGGVFDEEELNCEYNLLFSSVDDNGNVDLNMLERGKKNIADKLTNKSMIPYYSSVGYLHQENNEGSKITQVEGYAQDALEKVGIGAEDTKDNGVVLMLLNDGKTKFRVGDQVDMSVMVNGEGDVEDSENSTIALNEKEIPTTYTIRKIIRNKMIINDSGFVGNDSQITLFYMNLDEYKTWTKEENPKLSAYGAIVGRDDLSEEFLEVMQKNHLVDGAGLVSVWLSGIQSAKAINKGTMFIVGIILFVSMLNIINGTASNVCMRKKEFAQYYVVGMPPSQIQEMLLLEGTLSGIIAGIIGTMVGTLAGFGIVKYMSSMAEIDGSFIPFQVPYFSIITVIVISVVVMLLASMLALSAVHLNPVEDLAEE